MSMNRETRRTLQRQGQMGPDGEPVAPTRRQPPRPAARAAAPSANRAKPREFFEGVRNELRRVVWPSRAEVINYSTVVLITLAVLMALIFALDTAFAKAVLFLFKK
jgi:preprotein translocase subunit SecE